MITNKEYKQHPESYWKDKEVVTLNDIQNGWYLIPKGTKLRIHRKYQGFSLEGLDVCPHCKIGIKISISRVNPNGLTLLSIPPTDKSVGILEATL